MADHSEFVALARELIAAEGRLVTVQVMSKAAGDPTRPWIGPTAQTVVKSELTCAVFLPSSGTDFGTLKVSSEALKRTEQVCLVPPLSQSFEQMDFIVEADGQRWAVQWIEVLKPANEICLYYVGVKR